MQKKGTSFLFGFGELELLVARVIAQRSRLMQELSLDCTVTEQPTEHEILS
jgi:hypothetical protein